jgi:hypothetical protein
VRSCATGSCAISTNSVNNKFKYVYFETISTSFPLKINEKFERVTDCVLKCTILDLLLYADDVVFLCENEDDLQEMLNTLESWCYSNKINVNLEKSKIVHFRTQSVTRSNFSFIFNGKEVDIVMLLIGRGRDREHHKCTSGGYCATSGCA